MVEVRMRHKAGRIVAVLLVLLIIVGGGAVAAIYQKNSLAHVYFQKLTDKTEKTTPVATTDKTASSTIDETKLKAQLKQLQFVGNSGWQVGLSTAIRTRSTKEYQDGDDGVPNRSVTKYADGGGRDAVSQRWQVGSDHTGK